MCVVAGSVAAGVAGSVAGDAASSIFGGGGGSSAAQGATNIAGGILSAQEAQQLAQSVNPFGQYNSQFASQLAGLSGPGAPGGWTYGNPSSSGLTELSNLVNGYAGGGTGTNGLTTALNGQAIGQQLNNLVANPSSIYQTPQYQAAFGQGQNAVNATLAAQGLNASGNQLAALQSYGQTFGQNAYNTQLSQLSGLYGQSLGANQQAYNQIAGMNQQGQAQNAQAFSQMAQLSGLSTGSPQAAAQLLTQGYSGAGNAIGQGIGQLGTAAGNLLGGLGGTTSNPFSVGGTTTSEDISGSGGLFGTSAGIDSGGGYTYSGTNSYGF